ncbi:thioester domain-containing protein [Glycomyces xiaoerkulensis]|uniref:thioester domain-containing protein n=1 Tax=Glycomyces xiaoerkulensis TaxID=2038139 RepID=UPI000C26A286|nr:thioester domain-containing protein [Glycomyces xiaoerkulensis]
MIRKTLKGSLAAAAGLALGLGSAGVAGAQDGGDEDPQPTATGTYDKIDDGIQLHGLIDGDEPDRDPAATLLGLELAEDDTRLVYCIQIGVPLFTEHVHEERAWGDTEVEDLPLVLGVLLNGFDGANAGDLVDAAEVAGEDLGDWSAEQVAYAGTQSAIWTLTDGWEIDGDDPTAAGDGVDNAVTGIQDYLLDNTDPVEEPGMDPEFDVDGSEAETDGTTVGPFTVATNFGKVEFQQPDGATIVDENGEAIDEFTDGQTIYVEFDEAEAATVTITTESITWVTPVGRAFVPIEGEETVTGQNLILAEEHLQEVAGEVEFELIVEEAPPEETTPAAPQLPETGSSLTTLVGVGAAVLAAGAAAIWLMRRRTATGGDWG